MKRLFSILTLVLSTAMLFACGGGGAGGGTNPVPSYTVNYDGNDNTGGSVPIDSNNYAQGQTVTVLGNTGNLVKTNYSFAGWNTQAGGSGTTYAQGQTFPVGTANVTLYAKWTANPTYTVTYEGNGNTGGIVPTDSTNYEQGQAVTVLGNTGNLMKSGYSFTGWNTHANGSGTTYAQAQTFTMGPANVTLYAKWTANPTYTVTYYGNGSTVGIVPVDSTNYEQGQTITVLGNTGNLVKAGYTFVGWNTQANGSGTSYAQGQTFTMGPANVTLYAMWTANPTYTATYNGNGNTGGNVPIDSNNYQQGQTVTVLANNGNLVKNGYTFVGWNTQANGSGTSYAQGQTFTMGPANVTLYAMWTANPTYTATYNGNGNTGGNVPIDSNNYQQGQTVTVLANNGNLVKNGYTFVGWNTQANGSGTSYAQGQTFTMGPANVTLYAMWTSKIPRFAYVANNAGNNVSQYTIATTGALIPMYPATVAAGTGPTSVTADPSGKYVYVTNHDSSDVSQYTIGADGTLTPMSQAKVSAGAYPYSVTVDPSGKYVYVTNHYSSDVSQYTIGADGALTSMATATVAAGTEPVSITVDPAGRYVYVANKSSNNVSQYTIGADGALTSMATATVAAGTEPVSITVDPAGRYVYVVNGGVSYSTIGANGALSPMTSTASMGPAYAMSIAVDPSGKYVYLGNTGNSPIFEYTIGANGALTIMPNLWVMAGGAPLSVTVDPSGKYVYVANEGSDNVSQFTIGADGALTPMTTATVAAGWAPYSITTVGSSTPPPTAKVAGTWSGTWSSKIFVAYGNISATISQSGTTFTGSITLTGSSCFSTSTITGGTVSGNTVSWSSIGIGNFYGTVSGAAISGTYYVNVVGQCDGDTGTFSAIKQ